jgi:hypothetical protein
MNSVCAIIVLALVFISCANCSGPTGECSGTLSGNSYNSNIVEKGSEYWKENVLDSASAGCATGEYFYFFQISTESSLNISGAIGGELSLLDGKIHREFPSRENEEHDVNFVRVMTSDGFLTENASGKIDFERDAFSYLTGNIITTQDSDYDLSCSFRLPEGEGFRSTNASRCK